MVSRCKGSCSLQTRLLTSPRQQSRGNCLRAVLIIVTQLPVIVWTRKLSVCVGHGQHSVASQMYVLITCKYVSLQTYSLPSSFMQMLLQTKYRSIALCGNVVADLVKKVSCRCLGNYVGDGLTICCLA